MNHHTAPSTTLDRTLTLVLLAAFLCGSSLSAQKASAVPAASVPPTKPLFEEIAAKVGLDFVHFNGMTGKLYFPEMMGGSVALLDYDNDGDLDLYFGQGSLYFDDRVDQLVVPTAYPHPITDRLYRNELISPTGGGELRFLDVTEQAGLEAFGNTMGIATGDFDNDGFVDLYLTNFGSNVLLRNRGDGSFLDVTAKAKADDDRWSVAASFFDYDRDGWLDLVVGNYVDFRKETAKDCTSVTGAFDYCGPQSYFPLDNRLLRNRGDGTFEDLTIKALERTAPGSTLGLVTADFNSDGWLDLYVANDQMVNDLWINQGNGTFVNDAMISGAAVDINGFAQASMGVVAADLNGDGSEDLFMSHLAMEMNTLYLNDGNGQFRDASRDSGLGLPSWSSTGFGTALGDFDHDGWLDLYLGNGAVKRVEAQLRDKENHPLREENALYLGTGAGSFVEAADERRVDRVLVEVTRGVASGDLDNDGAIDLVEVNNGGKARLLRNVGGRGHWLGLELRWLGPSGSSVDLKTRPERSALGAEAVLHWKDGSRMARRVHTDGSYASASDPRLVFGLGAAPAPDWIEVRWPNGSRERFAGIPAARYSVLRAGQGSPIVAAEAQPTPGPGR